jgi:DNA polymerase I-like protein with 3'-5' exonuclease and polymerase domains
MHSITGLGIYNGRNEAITYEQFVAAKDDKSNPLYETVKKCRALGKAVNFGSQYRIKPGKLSRMLMVNKQDATDMLEAKAVAFPVAEAWAEAEMAAIYEHGTVKTLLGAVRHLAKMIDQASSGDEEGPQRQALSFKIQGSAAEMTKLAEGRMWKARLEQVFDCEVIAPIHDECVFSVAIPDLVPFMASAHACMVGDYAGMELPIKSSISFGPSFGEQIEIGDLPLESAVIEGLKKAGKA